MKPIRSLVILAALAIGGSALAQDKGTLTPKPLPPLANPNDPKLVPQSLRPRLPFEQVF